MARGTGRRFADRAEAGAALAAVLRVWLQDAHLPPGAPRTVLALPRGGVPVAAPVAAALDATLDVLVVRKLGVPGQPELAMGAVGPGGVVVWDEEVGARLALRQDAVDAVLARERAELTRREQAFRGGRPPLDVQGHVVFVVDDGIATGSTMRAAVRAVRALEPAHVVVAVPTAAVRAVELLREEADDVVVVDTPEPYLSVGSWYEVFTQTTDDEVRALLAQARPA